MTAAMSASIAAILRPTATSAPYRPPTLLDSCVEHTVTHPNVERRRSNGGGLFIGGTHRDSPMTSLKAMGATSPTQDLVLPNAPLDLGATRSASLTCPPLTLAGFFSASARWRLCVYLILRVTKESAISSVKPDQIPQLQTCGHEQDIQNDPPHSGASMGPDRDGCRNEGQAGGRDR